MAPLPYDFKGKNPGAKQSGKRFLFCIHISRGTNYPSGQGPRVPVHEAQCQIAQISRISSPLLYPNRQLPQDTHSLNCLVQGLVLLRESPNISVSGGLSEEIYKGGPLGPLSLVFS